MVAEPLRRRSGAPLFALIAWCWLGTGCSAPPAEPQPQREPADATAARATAERPAAHAPRRSAAREQAAVAESDDAAVRRQLRDHTVGRITLTAETGGYLDVVKLVRTVTGIPILVSPGARAVIADEALVLEIQIVAPLSVENLLDLMIQRSAHLGWTVRHGVVMVTSKAEARGELVLRMHDVRDLVFARTEFIPPVIRDLPTGELEGDGSRSGGEGDEKLAAVEPDTLLQAVKLATRPESWDTENGGTIEYLDSGYLLVTATPEMQRAVERALFGLR